MSILAPGPIHCPSCNTEVGRHQWLQRKRIRDFSCGNCGAQFEVILPAWRHYVTVFLLDVLLQVCALVLIFLALSWGWWALPLGIGLFFTSERGRSAWLQRNAAVRWINRESMERRTAGRWVPE